MQKTKIVVETLDVTHWAFEVFPGVLDASGRLIARGVRHCEEKIGFCFSLVLHVFAGQPLTYKIASKRTNLILLEEF